jgi:REP element-mobilizing transposase RayT
MGRPLRIEFAGAHYHVTARGNERKNIFKSQRDRDQFLSYLESSVVRYGAVIHAYCLMSNHYHLLIETPSGNLSQIMQHINGSYTNYFNIKRKRSGHLFQSRYKAILIEADEYAKELSRYIHLNTVRACMVTKPEEYRWSSYTDYIGERKAPDWLTTKLILGYSGTDKTASKNYRRFTDDLLEREYESPLNGAIAATILGSEKFVKEITARHVSGKEADRNVPAVKKLSSRPTMDVIIQAVQSVSLTDKISVKASIYFCHKYSGAKLKEIGNRFGIGESAVSQTSRRLALQIIEDKGLDKVIENLKDKLGLSRV